MKKRLAANKPIQTVLVRQRLGGVGNGSPTAPRPPEIDAVAAEEAGRAAAVAAEMATAEERAAAAVEAERAAEEERAAGVQIVAAEVLPVEAAAEETVSAEEAAGAGVPPSGDDGDSSSSSRSAFDGLSRQDTPVL